MKLTLRSGNRKTGPIPVTVSSPCTCPRSCPWWGSGCFAEYYPVGHRWRETPKVGLEWEEFCARVRSLPAGQTWRHNVAGDLAGMNEEIDADALDQLLAASQHTRDFTYSHKGTSARNLKLMGRANRRRSGMVINLSADCLEQADDLVAVRCGPVAVVLPTDSPKRLRSPSGNRVLVCPAETSGTTCEQCGLCQNVDRQVIIGFRAHGCAAKSVSERSRALGVERSA